MDLDSFDGQALDDADWVVAVREFEGSVDFDDDVVLLCFDGDAFENWLTGGLEEHV